MKGFLQLLILVTIILFMTGVVSCTRPNDLTENDPAKIEFVLYGQTKTYTNASAAKTTITGTNVLTVLGVKEPTAENTFTISFPAGNLQPGTYSVNTGVVTFREGNHVVTNVNNTDFAVTITSNNNGVINGTFAGTLYDHTTLANCTIVQGKIENVFIQ